MPTSLLARCARSDKNNENAYGLERDRENDRESDWVRVLERVRVRDESERTQLSNPVCTPNLFLPPSHFVDQ
jgi:hypothetical protein